MKKKLILLPITLTALTPAIGLVGCGNTDTPELETHIVTFSAGDHGSLEGETTVTVKGDKTTLGKITKPTVKADEEFGWFFDHWDHDDSYVIQDDVTITALYQDLSEYMIDMDYIIPIISFLGVEYAQGEFKSFTTAAGISTEMIETHECSPTVYHGIAEIVDSPFYEERYIHRDESGQCKQQERVSKDGEWEMTDVEEEAFLTPTTSIGRAIYTIYNRMISSGEELSFNTEKKCYEASWIEQTERSLMWHVEFYFLNSKLIAFNSDALDEEQGISQTTEATITYDEYTPELPISPN